MSANKQKVLVSSAQNSRQMATNSQAQPAGSISHGAAGLGGGAGPGSFQFGEYKSFKDFKKGKETPKFKFTSDIVRDILDNKSSMYSDPNAYREGDPNHKWKFKMHQLRYPTSVKKIKTGIDHVKSESYNLLQNMKQQSLKEERRKNIAREGAETSYHFSQLSMASPQNNSKLGPS